MTEWKYFKYEDFQCPHCKRNQMKFPFIDKLDWLRQEWGFPLYVNSGYRCPTHNIAVSTTGAEGPHTTGRAVDFSLSAARAMEVLEIALASGKFTGVGLNQKGNQQGRFLHLDDLEAPVYPRPNIWTY